MSAARVRSWIASGRLVWHRRGVYTMGNTILTREGRWMGAVLACGDRALLSHRSAAALWGVRPPWSGSIEVTTPLGNGAKVVGEDVHARQSRFAWQFPTTAQGIPVTSISWTLVDLASVLRPPQLRRAVEAADQLELFHLPYVEEALAVDPGRPGVRKLLTLLDDMKDHGVTRTRSDVEAMLLQLCIDHDLPRPQVNRYDNSREVDFRWPRHRLIVEVDGWQFHRSRRAFVADRARDRAALATGWRVARFPAVEILREPDRVAAELCALLSSR
jgi:very-short-patch-repair endonuclease